ncbi:MAG: Txe/YoeB family addiction module toxin [Beijerinckiaceae bacterium]
MHLSLTPKAFEHYLYWQQTDTKIAARINDLLKAAIRHPFTGIGKPEPLRNEYAGWWSRRITQEHRLVYRVTGTGEPQTLEVAACRFHY